MSEFKPWRVVQLALDGGPMRLERDDAYAGAFVVFWRGAIPLGRALLFESQLPLSGAQLAQLAAQAIAPAVGFRLLRRGFEPPLAVPDEVNAARVTTPDLAELLATTSPLSAIDRSLGADQRSEPIDHGLRVSVIVCTRDRADALSACLRALLRCDPPADEIVVVDNAPRSNETRRLVETFPGIRYVLEPLPGLSRARNAGVRATTGEIVAFTDDDVEVHPSWASRLRRALADPGVGSATGLVLPAALDTEAEWLFETAFGGFGQGYRALRFDEAFVAAMRPFGLPVWKIGAGANMALRRDALYAVGGFDERLGAGAAGCSEDSEMWYRLLANGYACVYDPAAVVLHRHRGSLTDLRKQMRMYARGHVAALLVQYERHRHRGNLHRLLVSLPRHYAGAAVHRLLPLSREREPMLGAQVAGACAGVWYYLKHRTAAGAPALAAASER